MNYRILKAKPYVFAGRQKLRCFFLNRAWLTTAEFSSMLMHHLVPHFCTLQCYICAHFMFSAKLKAKKNRLKWCITSISRIVLLISWMAFFSTKKMASFPGWRPFLNLNLAFKILYGSREKPHNLHWCCAYRLSSLHGAQRAAWPVRGSSELAIFITFSYCFLPLPQIFPTVPLFSPGLLTHPS